MLRRAEYIGALANHRTRAMAGLTSRFARSWQLIKASRAVLRADRSLLILPALSGLATVVLVAGFVGLAISNDSFMAALHRHGAMEDKTPFYAVLFAWYVVQYFIVIFFNTALVGAAMQVLDGGRPTLGSALKLALSRIGVILGYAVISATVGVILRIIAERLGFIGRLIEGVLGLAWTAATFLVVPILAAENVGPWQAITRSTALLRQTWGENLIGNAGISLVMSLITALIAFAGFGGGALLLVNGLTVLGVALIAAAAAAILLLILFTAALTGVYAAVVYRYAVVGKPPVGFDDALIRDAFTRKGG